MAIGVIFQAKGVTQAQYEQVLHQVNPDNRLPPGAIYHAGGPSADGFCVIEVWDSEEAMGQFYNAAVNQSIKDANIDVTPVVFQIINVIDK
jgi:hypothetical protein